MTLRRGRLQWSAALALLPLFAGFSAAWMNQRPVLEVRDGNLFITSATDRNITLQTLGASSVNVNGINLLQIASLARDASQLVERWKLGALADIENTLARITQTIEGRSGLVSRVNALEFGTDSNSSAFRPSRYPGGRNAAAIDMIARTRIQRLTARVRQTELQMSNLLIKLRTNECASNPCQNGATCDDMIDGFKCRCAEGWEGTLCNTDINECARYAGTDLGCQNGGTCQNLQGTFRCICKSNWFGIHCTEKTNNCDRQNPHELCGQGACVNQANDHGYTCICDPGWETDGTNPACTKDVNECTGRHPACSINPLVPCINVPGTFYCGGCPQGYTGNGHYCADIDECATNNGGCSTTPSVQCMNTMGSRVCSSCPTGYQGDGVTCTYVGACTINNGGCHPLATCINNPGMSDLIVQCRCPPEYLGDGMGPNGCVLSGSVGHSACNSNPCSHGTCIPNGLSDYTCRCESGYTGRNCDSQTNPCEPNPCRNEGTCSISTERTAVCKCSASFSGPRCETRRASCGSIIADPQGVLQFPTTGNKYPHGLSCAWVLITNASRVLNVTFTAFNLEQSTNCVFDFVQIHDGLTAGEHMMGRYCGSGLPRGGNVISTKNALYLWFHSDHSISSDGFTLEWNSIAPTCGGLIRADHGSISSPGSPGKYPKNRDCIWGISVTPGRRIQFHFFTMMLEEHPTCEYDYLEIRDGPSSSDQQLAVFCNHTHPPPLLTSVDEAWLHFHSDDSGQDFGFQITFSSIEGLPGCGGVHTATSGRITSPNYHNDNYELNLNCEWQIRLPAGERIGITWMNFELERSRSCRYDFVEIYDGAKREAPLIGRYCGGTLPPSVLSTTNVLLIRLKTDSSIGRKGFQLNYEIYCGGEFTEPTGVLKSPYYPNPYPAARVCIYKIIQPLGKAIELTIQDMDIEGWDYPDCNYDSLAIRDGDNENSTLIGTYCGTNSSIPQFPILSTHNYMWLKFKTDDSIHDHGFMATYSTVDRRCGGILKDPSGIIQTPSENGRYRNGEDCTWVIQAPPGFVVQLNWLTFALESHDNCRYDYIKISENITSTSKQDMGTYCGTTKPPAMTSQSQMMSIKFHTDDSLTRDGFTASYVFVDASRICGGHFSSPTGVIRSPNYPERYPTNRECEWFITASNRHQIELTIRNFDLENQTNCVYDYLEIRNGGTAASPLLGKYCGSDIPTKFKSFGSQMYLKFKSDSSLGGDGFTIDWNSGTIGCGGTLTTPSGTVTSPGYPQPYYHRAECNWAIRVSAGSVIQFVIVDLDLEEQRQCLYDFVDIFNGPNLPGNKLGRYCGTDHPLRIETTSNIAAIRFRSDFSGSGRGFHINYQALCHNTIRGFRGVIESPNFPNNYPDRVNCTWIIEAPLGNKLNITFSHFDLENGIEDSCAYDYLKIREGDGDQPDRDLGTFCGSTTLPSKIVSTERRVFLQLYSDHYIASKGFRLEWVVNGCGGHLTRPEGTITSPGWPNPYPKNVECEWTIEVDFMHSIEVTLVEVKLEKTRNCNYDTVAVYSGSDDTAPELIKTCHSTAPIIVTSSGRKVFIKFQADISFENKGFKATYKSVNIKCGGSFVASTGLIYSPNYPRNYDKNLDCEWLIQVAENHLVNLTFVDFDIEQTTNCTDDYVRIYDGASRDAALLESYCSNRLPPPIVSTSNELLVVLRTDPYITAKGFKATYDLACGARIVTNSQGSISMNPTVGLHTQIVNCTWIIIAENREDHVTLTLTELQVSRVIYWDDDCSVSSVQVFEGDGIDGPSLGTWCNNTVPPPITSQGNALTIHTTALYEGLYNVKFSGIYSVLNSACGGNYTAEHGTIATPGYPESYPRNIECVWSLRISPGNSISLSFREFDLIQSENCDLDYVEVREENGVGRVIGVYCGQNINQITSQKNLWVKFKSSADGTRKGFIADYNLKHGNDLSGPSGEIASPLYPNPYLLEGEYNWRILVDFRSSILITFKDFYIERYSDDCYIYLTIYDGYNEDAPVLMTKCGLTLPEPVRSTSNVVYIKFSAATYREGSWFLLSWLQVPRESNEDDSSKSNNACNEIISLTGPDNSTYTFNSPGWPEGYVDNLACSWTFESIPGTHLILKFHNMSLEESMTCLMDQVRVFSGNSLTSQREWSEIGRFCLSNSTNRDIPASNLMKVNFNTDYSLNRTGFNATVRKVCGGQMYRPNGVIEFNSTTNTERSGAWSLVTCQWNVTVKPGRTIAVTFMELDIASSTELPCGDHYLMLKNGGSDSSPLLGTGKYCRNSVPEPLQTTGNQLYVKVFGLRSHARFKLQYREVSTTCGSEVVLTEGLKSWEINSPNYPNIPSPHSECFWTIMAPGGERIMIHFLGRFDLTARRECDREYLEIRDGGTELSTLVGRYCGSHAPSSISTTGNFMYLHFYTDVADPKNGFRARVTIGENCGGIIRGRRGRLQSPNYPSPYANNVTCLWHIVGPPGHTIKIEFQDLVLRNSILCETNDYVEISERLPYNYTGNSLQDDSDMEKRRIGIYCGNTKPEIIETSGNEVIVKFRSSETGPTFYKGFDLNFTTSAERCGGELEGNSGEFSSPGHPNGRAHHYRFCSWKIKAPEGYGIKINILDLDMGETPDEPRNGLSPEIVICNDFVCRSMVKRLLPSGTEREFLSTGNTLMFSYWSGISIHRGFKARYTRIYPAPCGGVLTDYQGTLLTDQSVVTNFTTFNCIWKASEPSMRTTGVTFALTVSGVIGKSALPVTTASCRSRTSKVSLSTSPNVLSCISGNLTQEVTLRSPLSVNSITVLRGTSDRFGNRFSLKYRWHQCGGVLSGPSHTLSAPTNLSYPLDCVWHAKFPDNGEVIAISFKKLNLGSCTGNYITIRNGNSMSPELGKYCGSLKPADIISQSNQLWIEYHAENPNNEFELQLNTHQGGCGGLIQGVSSTEISSPGFPKQYPNNAECSWEIVMENGYHIVLEFIDRFQLETSTSCSNDFIQIYDWRDDEHTGISSWFDQGKVCGRSTPPQFFSTSNRMKILFRSNTATVADGFHARLNQTCGGILTVSKRKKYLDSPGWPESYDSNMVCNYTFLAPGKSFILEFTRFDLEGGPSDCRYDNVSITTEYGDDGTVWCRDNPPPLQRVESRLELHFKTDAYVGGAGFQVKYYLDECGGVITEPTDITSPSIDGSGNYYSRINCTWVVTAPAGKAVLLKFERFHLEYSRKCNYDYVAVYSSPVINETTRLALLCGGLNGSLPSLRSENGKMLVNFITDQSYDFGGFKAKIVFTTGAADGCGGDIQLTRSQTFRTQRGATYEGLEDCHWVIRAPNNNAVKLEISSIDLKNADSGANQAGRCSGDYLEVRDGAGPFAELIGRYCGNVIPPPMISTSNTLWIRFVTDGTLNGNGVIATLNNIPSPCGNITLEIGNQSKVLTSPGFPGNYPAGLRCRWRLTYPIVNKQWKKVNIHFVQFDLQDSQNCSQEGLSFADTQNKNYVSEGLGQDLIFSGTDKRQKNMWMDVHLPQDTYTYCGNGTPHDYYSIGTEVEILFKSAQTQMGRHRGFKLEYSLSRCDRNFTGVQGRIFHEDITDCWFTITAPVGYTISLYFNDFTSFDYGSCVRSGLEVHDGDFSNSTLGLLCGSTLPNPIFSSGNKLSFHSWMHHDSHSFESYDMTYTTTNKGPGCGGKLYNYGGRLTSPLYPGNYRNTSECTWDLRVPSGFIIELKFSVFDLGSRRTCETDFVEISNVQPNGEILSSTTYCGEDRPAKYHSSNEQVLVKYHTSPNNQGTGWVMTFLAQRHE